MKACVRQVCTVVHKIEAIIYIYICIKREKEGVCDVKREREEERENIKPSAYCFVCLLFRNYMFIVEAKRAIKICLCFILSLVARFSKVKNRTRQREKKNCCLLLVGFILHRHWRGKKIQ